jgi:hypothetical protein
MPPVGFEPTISVLERAKTVRVLDRAATAIGKFVTDGILMRLQASLTENLRLS